MKVTRPFESSCIGQGPVYVEVEDCPVPTISWTIVNKPEGAPDPVITFVDVVANRRRFSIEAAVAGPYLIEVECCG